MPRRIKGAVLREGGAVRVTGVLVCHLSLVRDTYRDFYLEWARGSVETLVRELRKIQWPT